MRRYELPEVPLVPVVSRPVVFDPLTLPAICPLLPEPLLLAIALLSVKSDVPVPRITQPVNVICELFCAVVPVGAPLCEPVCAPDCEPVVPDCDPDVPDWVSVPVPG